MSKIFIISFIMFYLASIALAFRVVWPLLKRIITSPRKDLLIRYLNKVKKPLQKHINAPDMLTSFFEGVHNLKGLLLLPGLFVHLLIMRYHPRLMYRMHPINAYMVILAFLTVMAFVFCYEGKLLAGLVLAALLILFALEEFFDYFRKKDGKLKVLAIPKNKSHLADVLITIIFFVLAYGCVYYGLSRNGTYYPNAMSPFDAIYYSLFVFSNNVSETTPSVFWRVVVLSEVAIGYVITVAIIGTVLAVWLKKHET